MSKKWLTGPLAALLLVAAASAATAANTIILPRAGQVGIGAQGSSIRKDVYE